MVAREQYGGKQHYIHNNASPKQPVRTQPAAVNNNNEHRQYLEDRGDAESRAGTTTLMECDHSTIRTRDDITLPTRQTPGNLPAWAPALAEQKPPTTIKATSPTKQAGRNSKNYETMDFMKNDNSFHVVASLLVDKFEEALKSEARYIKVTEEDKIQIERMIPETARENFVAALRFRLDEAPEFSRLPIHTVTRNCFKLGMTRLDEQNILFAPPGTIIQLDIQPSAATTRTIPVRDLEQHSDNKSVASRGTVRSEVDEEQSENLARQQILAELREASTLMAESVTPEAAQFWKRQVVELQNKLKTMQQQSQQSGDRSVATRSVSTAKTAEILEQNERLMASLQQNTGYVPPTKQEYVPPYTPKSHISETPKVNPKTLPIVDVVAPADLPGGYMFEAEIDNKRFLATVPNGGVKQGETFTSTMRDIKKKNVGIPSGRWRDGLFDIFKYGRTHPLVVYSFLCPPIALAQIMTRMGFDFKGHPANVPEKGLHSTWGTMIAIMSMWAVMNVVVLHQMSEKAATGATLSFFDYVAFAVVNAALVAYNVYATANTRASIREYSGIEERPIWIGNRKFPTGQDFLLATFGMPLVIAQLGRHTASYDNFEASFCTHHGLSKDVTLSDILACNNPNMLGCNNPYTEIGSIV
eukprot:scaffold4009_cov124-Cylindrotheca_fusiformis.AAC.3